MSVEISQDDVSDANIDLARIFLTKACSTIEKEKKIKNLLMAEKTIQKTLQLLNYSE